MPSVELDGRRVPYEDGDTIASALYRAGVRTFSRSFKYHRRRGLYCLAGDCANCLLTVDGEPCVPACTTPAEDGQVIARENGWPSADRDVLAVADRLHWLLPVGFYYKTLHRPQAVWPVVERWVRRAAGLGSAPLDRAPAEREARHHHPDVLVVGGGVAGLAAAHAAAEEGAHVLLCDEGASGDRIAPGPTRSQITLLTQALRRHDNVTVLERATAVGIYEGPLVPVDGPDFLELVHPERIVVATGALERHAVFPGNDLPGVWLGRGAARLAGVHGVGPGARAAVVATTAEGIEHLETLRDAGVEIASAAVPAALADSVPSGVPLAVDATIVQATGRKQVECVVLEGAAGRTTVACDTLVLSLGLEPRDALLRGASGVEVVGAGDVVEPGCSVEQAAESGRRAIRGGGERAPDPEAAPPSHRASGFVCLCEDVTARDLDDAWTEGFCSTELLKRYTTATMGPCQGALCGRHLSAFVRARGGSGAVGARTTARPPARPLRLEDAAAGLREPIERRTTLHDRHLEHGATMDWLGTWKRPLHYGDAVGEYWGVRRGVGIMDVGTLGKFLVTGADATELLERIYPCHIGDIAEGRLRYGLLLNEAGYVMDDGLVCSLGRRGYYVTATSAGADHVEAWLRNWIDLWGLDVHVVNQTAALGAISVAGPRARDVLAALASDDVGDGSLRYLRHAEVDVGGVPCRVLRLGFVGELGYELHHPASRSVRLWDALLKAGSSAEIRPYGLDALDILRLDKGHIIVGQDSDFDSTPARLGLEFTVKLEKDRFLGKAALERSRELSLGRRLARLVFDGETPSDGAPLTSNGTHAGHLTSSHHSPVLGHGIALGWLRETNGGFSTSVECGDATARVVSAPFYDPEGLRPRA